MDVTSLTLGEIAKVEEMSGLPIAALGDPEKPKGKLLVALAYVIKKRENPKFTQLEAEALTMADIEGIIGTVEDTEDNLKK